MRKPLPRSLASRLAVVVLAVVPWLGSPAESFSTELSPDCAVVDIHQIGWDRLSSIKETDGLGWWIEIGGQLVICGNEIAIASVAARHELLETYAGLDPAQLEIASGFHQSEWTELGLEVIAQDGGAALVHRSDPRLGLLEDRSQNRWRGVLQPAAPDSVVIREATNKPPRRRAYFAPETQGLVDLVDGDRWFADLETLASLNRYTHNPGINDARDWLVAELSALPGLQVATSSFQVGGTTAYNVIATLTGQVRPDDWYIIGAHYDSISENTQVAAPGAEDNGSGCAGVLEMARIFTAHPPDATIFFICYSGEELGLLGSRDHVDDLIVAGDLDKIQTMLNLDMIGYTSDADLDCKLETAPFANFLFETFEDAALLFTTLRILTDESPCCSDHDPYLDEGVPALLTIEADWFQYPFYHTVNDLPEHITIAMGREILKMNVAAMAQLAGVPEPALFTDGFESGDASMWSAIEP